MNDREDGGGKIATTKNVASILMKLFLSHQTGLFSRKKSH
jgi:hypothetical protein